MTPSPPRPTPSRDGVEGLNTTPSPVPGVYTGTGTESGRGAERGTTPSPSGPEHFAAIVNRHFVRLKEMTMTAETSPISSHAWDTNLDAELLSAEAHYARGSELLRKAGADLVPFSDMHAITTLARTHFAAAQAATAIWPAQPDEGHLLEENSAMARELARLLTVAQAARKYVTADTGGAGPEYDALAAAVNKLQDDA